MNKYFALTLDLESEISGVLADEYSIFKNPDRIEKLLSFLKEEDVKLSVFVVGEILNKFPEIVTLFKSYPCEFHCHSFSHHGNMADSEAEIIKSKKAYSGFFKKNPIGYRAPQGKISDRGIHLLEKHGFKFDASIFPSYYPNPFKYIFKNREVHPHSSSNIIEIPFTSITPLRLTFSISYVKLLGFKAYQILLELFKLPKTIVFGSHLHDFLITSKTLKKLPLFWKIIYNRNRFNGKQFLKKIIDLFKKKGYKFVYMSDIYLMNKSETTEKKQDEYL